MIDCTTCRFLSNIQPIQFHPHGITSVAVCLLFNIQINNLCVDECTGKMPIIKETPNESNQEIPSST